MYSVRPGSSFPTPLLSNTSAQEVMSFLPPTIPTTNSSYTSYTMSKIIVVFGATGQQGSSVVNAVLEDAKLSKEYTIRGTTRDPGQTSAQALAKKGVEVVRADVDDAASLKKAFEGAHVVSAN